MNIEFIAAILLTAVAVTLAVIMPAVEHHRIFQSGMAVDAVIKANVVKRGQVYITWAYTCNGMKYETAIRARKRDDLPAGTHGAILVNKNNPKKIYKLSDPDKKIHMYLFVTFLLSVAAVLFGINCMA